MRNIILYTFLKMCMKNIKITNNSEYTKVYKKVIHKKMFY